MTKLIKGKKYNIKFDYGMEEGIYYIGICDSLCGQRCDCCNKELINGHLFKKPYKNATYEECVNGAFEDQIKLGKTCINKVEIIEYETIGLKKPENLI